MSIGSVVRLSLLALGPLLTATALVACNAVLGTEPGTYTAPDSGLLCSQGQRLCFGTVCKSIDDPKVGCSDLNCAACNLPHVAVPACVGADAGFQCTIDTSAANKGCSDGYADCNATSTDGCETSLSLPAHCGRCDVDCTKDPANNKCGPGATGYACTNKCQSGETECSNTCVKTASLQTDPLHCGGCNTCPAPATGAATGSATCTAGKCGVQCNAGLTACGAQGQTGCFDLTTSPTNCGACGTLCAVPDTAKNAAATCASSKCGFACRQGFLSCNGNLVDGCETPVDVGNCGKCACKCTTSVVGGSVSCQLQGTTYKCFVKSGSGTLVQDCLP